MVAKICILLRKSKIKVKKFLSIRGMDWGASPLIITDEDFASLSVGEDLNIPRILLQMY